MSNITEFTDGITSQFITELIEPSFDVGIDITEIFIDDFLKNEVFKEIPIVKTVIGTIQAGVSINQFFMAKKIVAFIKSFNDGTISNEAYNNFRHKVNTDVKYSQKVIEKLLVIIDKQVEIKQTLITANLFKAYVNGKIDWKDLNSILITLNNLHPNAYPYFFSLQKNDFKFEVGYPATKRNWEVEALLTASGFGITTSSWNGEFQLNEDGKKLYEHGLKPLKTP